MILPVGDEPNPRGFRAWVTWLLIAANLLVHALLGWPRSFTPADPDDPRVAAVRALSPQGVPLDLTAWDLFLLDHGYTPADPGLGDLFASMFLHAGLAHLGGNLLMLWIYGDNVEHRLGRLPFLAAYLAAGVAGTLGFAALASDPAVPMVGASGAISGVLGAYLALFPRNRVRVFVALFPFVFGVRLVPAPVVLGVYLLLDNVLPVLVGAEGSVAHGAHLGGFAAGLAVGFVARRVAGPEFGGDARALRTADGPEEQARVHLQLGEAYAATDPATAFHHLTRTLDLTRDPEVAARARAALGTLPLHPDLRRRLGL